MGISSSIRNDIDMWHLPSFKLQTQEIVSLLNRGKSVRDVCGRLGVSPNLVTKVRRILREWNDGDVTMVG